MPGPGDEVGYAMSPVRGDDCSRAAIATATQVPIEQVPDPGIDRQRDRGVPPEQINQDVWTQVVRWAEKCGWELTYWGPDELPVPRERSIGVVVADDGVVVTDDDGAVRLADPDEVVFADHCLVMSHDRLAFDPAASVIAPPGFRTQGYAPDQITYGLTFEEKE